MVSRKRTNSFEDFSTDVKIESLADLIKIGEEYKEYYSRIQTQVNSQIQQIKKCTQKKGRNKKLKRQDTSELEKEFASLDETHSDYFKLQYIVDDLKELNTLIGLADLKKSIVRQILFVIQKMHDQDFMNCVIYGNPGCGKTTIAKILGNIYCGLGLLSEFSETKLITRAELTGQYLGETTQKVKKVMDESLNNVVILDEAESMGSKDNRDSYSKEALDYICGFLSEHPNEIIMIICGYEKEVKHCFFGQNPGLERRFSWRFYLDDYSSEELKEILLHQMKISGWNYTDDFISSINLTKDLFKNNGGDIVNFLSFAKSAHSMRVFGQSSDLKKILNKDDYIEGMKMYKSNLQHREKEDNLASRSMYI